MKSVKQGAVKGPQITPGMGVRELVESMGTMGFQATNLNDAVRVIKKMRDEKATIFLAFTSNMVSSGLREIFAQLLKMKLVDAVITTVGSVEEDLMKCSGDFLLGDFNMDDEQLRKKQINRIGNVLVPNKFYVDMEKKLIPFFGTVCSKQKEMGRLLAPSEIIAMLGETVKDENSILHWASKNKIPIFCPAITDGAFGLQLFFFKQDHKDFGIDVTADMKELSSLTFRTKKTGAIILGGGVAKHHTIGANLMKGGLDYAVYVTTAEESDGSLSGAMTKEAVSWGKIKAGRDHVTVKGEATIIFPLIAACMMPG